MGRESIHWEGDPSSGSDLGNREEGDFLSDEEEELVNVPEQSIWILKADDYQYLLAKILSALEQREFPIGEDNTASGWDKKVRPRGTKEFFSRSTAAKRVFPFPECFEKQLKA